MHNRVVVGFQVTNKIWPVRSRCLEIKSEAAKTVFLISFSYFNGALFIIILI